MNHRRCNVHSREEKNCCNSSVVTSAREWINLLRFRMFPALFFSPITIRFSSTSRDSRHEWVYACALAMDTGTGNSKGRSKSQGSKWKQLFSRCIGVWFTRSQSTTHPIVTEKQRKNMNKIRENANEKEREMLETHAQSVQWGFIKSNFINIHVFHRNKND